MNLAFSHANLLLGRPLKGHPDADILARTVMSVFAGGIRNPVVIAKMTAAHTRGLPIHDILKKRNDDNPLALTSESPSGAERRCRTTF
jgi:hypothetical protein